LVGKLGLKHGSILGVNLKTGADWFRCQYGAYYAGITLSTLYDTLGADSIEYTIDQCELTALVTAPATVCAFFAFVLLLSFLLPDFLSALSSFAFVCVQADKFVKLRAASKCKSLTHLIINSASLSSELVASAKAVNLTLLTLDEIESWGAKNKQTLKAPSGDDICLICYTSGLFTRSSVWLLCRLHIPDFFFLLIVVAICSQVPRVCPRVSSPNTPE
jgi:long-subunit acyl-CoA synthetase (AMP-forming)